MSNEEVLAQISTLGGPMLLTVLLVTLAILILLLVPAFIVAFSRRVQGTKKLLWVALMLTLSWFAWPAWRRMLRQSEPVRDEEST